MFVYHLCYCLQSLFYCYAKTSSSAVQKRHSKVYGNPIAPSFYSILLDLTHLLSYLSTCNHAISQTETLRRLVQSFVVAVGCNRLEAVASARTGQAPSAAARTLVGNYTFGKFPLMGSCRIVKSFWESTFNIMTCAWYNWVQVGLSIQIIGFYC